MATFFELQEKNRKRTKLIVVCFVLFFIWLGAGLDLTIYFWGDGSVRTKSHGYSRDLSPSSVVSGAPKREKRFRPIFTVIIGLAGVGVAWWSMTNAAANVLSAMHAKPADRNRSPEELALVNVVEEMAISSSIIPPKVWIIPDPDPNALAVGLTSDDYHIAVTQGLLRTLTRDELQGVVAHEIAHLKNQDTRLMTTLTVLVGLSALISEFVARSRLLNLAGEGGDSEESKIGVALFVLWLVSVLVAPLATQLMALMVSREREFLADASAAQFTRNPEALAHALEKIAAATARTAFVKPASAHLCIASPLSDDLDYQAADSWFATHPPIKTRIHRLLTIGKRMAVQGSH
ncbi:MAG: M48 family metallopeptidase [Deltaproteobacteria bacterium]|nr:M48 family metallopeptidase [Deltaproteobacteria bacterium]